MMTMPRWHKWFALLQIVKSAWLVEVKKFDMELPETGFSALIPSLYLGRVQSWRPFTHQPTFKHVFGDMVFTN